MYDWKPRACSHCKVFGHSYEKCKNRQRSEEEIKAQIDAEEKEKSEKEAKAKKEAEERQNRSRNWQQQRRNILAQGYGNKQVDRAKNMEYSNSRKNAENVTAQTKKAGNVKMPGKNNSTNQFSALNSIREDDETESRILKGRMVVNGISNEDSELRILKAINVNQVEDKGDLCKDKNGKS
jgi:hypothetical protein